MIPSLLALQLDLQGGAGIYLVAAVAMVLPAIAVPFILHHKQGKQDSADPR